MNSSEQPAIAYGRRLLPHVLDEDSQNDPTRVYASCAISASIVEGFRDWTVRDIANATNALSWWMKRAIGQSQSFETIAYLGASDIRYSLACLAGIKCGWVVRT
jgi:hypothetical protein